MGEEVGLHKRIGAILFFMAISITAVLLNKAILRPDQVRSSSRATGGPLPLSLLSHLVLSRGSFRVRFWPLPFSFLCRASFWSASFWSDS